MIRWFKYQLLKRSNRTVPFEPHHHSGYRTIDCAECRDDNWRHYLAAKYDDKPDRLHVQEMICRRCEGRFPWWHFAKLPVTKLENRIVQERGGKAW